MVQLSWLARPVRILPLVLALASITRPAAAAARASDDADTKEVLSLRLTTEKVAAYSKAVNALAKLEEKDPALKQRLDAGGEDAHSLDQKVKELDGKFPEVAAAVHAAGMSSREYIVTGIALFADVMAVGMKRQGLVKKYPDTISPENAAFVEEHYAELEALMKRLTHDGESKDE